MVCVHRRTDCALEGIFYGRRKTGKGRRGESYAYQCSEGKNTLHSQRQEKKIKQVGGAMAREADKHSL